MLEPPQNPGRFNDTPVGFEENTRSLMLRYETFAHGNGYVGSPASEDDNFMLDIYNSLVREWATNPTEPQYIDTF